MSEFLDEMVFGASVTAPGNTQYVYYEDGELHACAFGAVGVARFFKTFNRLPTDNKSDLDIAHKMSSRAYMHHDDDAYVATYANGPIFDNDKLGRDVIVQRFKELEA